MSPIAVQQPDEPTPPDDRGEPGVCRSCGAPVFWRITARGKATPHNPDGISHFATCPQASTWRKR